VPGQVEDLLLFVNKRKPIINSSCVTQYLIYWDKVLYGGLDKSVDSWEEESFFIEDLEGCVEYEVQ
jgi:hypothetical protein